jgi:hypothetical protein
MASSAALIPSGLVGQTESLNSTRASNLPCAGSA